MRMRASVLSMSLKQLGGFATVEEAYRFAKFLQRKFQQI